MSATDRAGTVCANDMNQPESECIRLYRFMKEKWAITSIETSELRVGRLAELNDPFEFVSGITSLRDDAPKDYIRDQLSRQRDRHRVGQAKIAEYGG